STQRRAAAQRNVWLWPGGDERCCRRALRSVGASSRRGRNPAVSGCVWVCAMTERDIQAGAATLWEKWQRSLRIPELPQQCRPRDRTEAYAIQAKLADLSGQAVVGWKIAATSVAGQAHIRVDGPLAGLL